MKAFFIRLFLCHILGDHQWTSKADQGIKPSREELESSQGFWKYARVYCSRCGEPSKYNKA